MLTDEQIEKYLYKFANRQEELSLDVVRVITKRLNSVKKLASFDKLMTLEETAKTRQDIHTITELIRSNNTAQKENLTDSMWDLALVLYLDYMAYYEREIAFQENAKVQAEVSDAILQAIKEYNELTKNPVIVMRDLANPSKLKNWNIDDAYKSIVNESAQYTNLSDTDFDNAMKRTTMQLFDSGVRYANNSSDLARSSNIAIRANILNSVKNLIKKIDDVVKKQFKSDGIELSAHIYPAPDHAPAQGHQFTKTEVDKMQNGEDFTDVNGITYAGFPRQIGTWNCRHYFKSIKLGVKPEYNQEQLDKILADNERGYTAPNGRHYTLYECTQVQRRYEREIRKAKQNYLLHKSLNDKVGMQSARTRVGSLTTQYKQFSRACDIPAKLERIRVKDYQ